MQSAIEPAVVSGLHAWCSGFHEILGVEVGARGIGRTSSVHDGQMALLPQRLKCRHGGMQTEEAVEINHGTARDIDGGAHSIVQLLAVRYDDVEAVGGAALEDHNQTLVPRTGIGRAVSYASEKTRDGRRTNDSECAVSKKYASRDRHKNLLSPLKLG